MKGTLSISNELAVSSGFSCLGGVRVVIFFWYKLVKFHNYSIKII